MAARLDRLRECGDRFLGVALKASDYAGIVQAGGPVAFAFAVALAPGEAELLNNQGWSYLVRGRWTDALTSLGQAAAIDPESERITTNLVLARAAVAESLPQRRDGESESDWAARLNDAGVIAKVQGDNKKAAAAFAQAVEVRSQYYERAANNLAQVDRTR